MTTLHAYEMNIEMKLADINDAEEILYLHKLSYRSEAAIFDDYSIPPLRQTLDEIMKDFENQVFLKVIDREVIIGSVRAYS